jgi:hypothetical protein
MTLGPQLQAVADELEAATARLRTIARSTPEQLWTRRPEPARWSVAECVVHLNLTSAAFMPLVDEGLARAEPSHDAAQYRYRRDLPGWLLWRTMGPPVRFRVKTTAAFVPAIPTGGKTSAELVSEFEGLQGSLLARVRGARGLAIDRVKIASPFNARLRYNLYSALTILPRHQHRHLWQAEEVARALAR